MQLPRKKIPLFFSLSTFLLFFAFIAKKSPVHQIRTETPPKKLNSMGFCDINHDAEKKTARKKPLKN